jgi:hypothetical protein
MFSSFLDFSARSELNVICLFYVRMIGYFDFLLLDETPLDHFLKLLLDQLGLVLLLLLELLEVLDVLVEDLVAFLEGSLPFVGLVLQVLDFLFDDAVGHGDEEHFLFLLQGVHHCFVLHDEVFILLPVLDYLQCALD